MTLTVSQGKFRPFVAQAEYMTLGSILYSGLLFVERHAQAQSICGFLLDSGQKCRTCRHIVDESDTNTCCPHLEQIMTLGQQSFHSHIIGRKAQA